ncbi:protein-tyrosine-phosphatase [Bizionia gelidisalsuginis]|uniref:Protein-tyrosine-phosphatase n=2 Tax=Bizionia TaxID=283785 RepID=A0A8H2LGI4_9FLAO|nr:MULTISPECIES: protein-tyrosine-phosphatase [Bizionia]TYB80139.1 protein-tyrosine-phosphatase [Bizionia saleffrena]TYC16985.1 protein-tyrosine-phosphatase [Bizionia gelidisalsuginis]
MNAIFPEIKKLLRSLAVETITPHRKNILDPIIEEIQQKVTQNKEIRLNFICTHNSRRSHLAQIWAQTLAYYYNIHKVHCYSAGTEATALFPKVIATLQQTGFQITTLSGAENPVYSIKYATNAPPIIGFSKATEHPFNPKTAFIAIMTCSQADEGCPFIAGAERRFSLTYSDPKRYDNTPKAADEYNQTSLQIATELYYVFSKIKA